MKSKLPADCFNCSSECVSTTWWAPIRRASSDFEAEEVNAVTSHPHWLRNWSARCPRPPIPTTPTLWVASGAGLDRRQHGEWIANGVEEGLPSKMTYTVFQDSRGRVWAGSSRGLSLYHPEADLGAPQVGFPVAGNTHQATPQGDIR